MKRLGSILHSVDNMLVIRSDKTLDTSVLSQNSTVFTKRMKKIGRIKEFFGPVKSPYISVRVFKDITGSELVEMKNERLYLK